jgi:nucleotide-binding universal stress UspA family protein
MSNIESQVVVAYDFTPSGRAALYRAVALATRAPFHILHFIYVLEPGATYQHAEQMQQLMTDEIAAELKLTNAADKIHFFVHARIGKPAGEILSLSKEIGADLIIVGSHGHTGVKHLVLGSVSEHVVREAGCTVEVARPKAYEFVALEKIIDSPEPHHAYIPPHRYSYDGHRLQLRPNEWPLY